MHPPRGRRQRGAVGWAVERRDSTKEGCGSRQNDLPERLPDTSDRRNQHFGVGKVYFSSGKHFDSDHPQRPSHRMVGKIARNG